MSGEALTEVKNCDNIVDDVETYLEDTIRSFSSMIENGIEPIRQIEYQAQILFATGMKEWFSNRPMHWHHNH